MLHLNEDILEIGTDLLERAHAAEPKFYQPAWAEQQLLNWVIRDDDLKNRLFRFIEVLPALHNDREIASYLKLYLAPNGNPLPGILRFALGYKQPDSLRGRLAALATRYNADRMAHKFVAASTAEQTIAVIKRMRRQKRAFTIDLLGEAITSERQAEQVTQTYMDLIRDIGTAARDWPAVDPIDYDSAGKYPITNISVKLTALYSQFDPIARERTMAVVGDRLAAIFREARKYDAFVNVDLEQYRYKNITLAIFEEVLRRPEFRDFPDGGIVVQAYLRDAEEDLERLIKWNRRRGAPLAVRLVKGAYWDYEALLAGHKTPPVYLQKWQSDACFERCTDRLFEEIDHIRPAFGTHNVRSIAYAIARARQAQVDIHDYEFQMLYGMGEPLKTAVSERGLFLRIYTPYGSLVPGMAYLIRRLIENTANESFLRQSFAEHQPPEILLADPRTGFANGKPPTPTQQQRILEDEDMTAFTNEAFTDFSNNENREKMIGAFRDWREKLGRSYPLIINGERVSTDNWLTSVNPADTSETIGKVAQATTAQADQAVSAARAALPAWRKTPHRKRAELLRKTANIMRRRRMELDALLVLEAGKAWLEADGDVAEAIDFCDYYANEIERIYDQPQTRTFPGETNVYFYEPRGVVLVVAPWNFPMAILAGMTVAALVTGNTVIMKPASFTPVVGAILMEMLEEAGVPKGVLNFVPGPGRSVGDHLVRHQGVNMIVFTGSREVGLGMIKAAADVPKGQRFIKKVVAELGGKNALIVDSDADIDAAVQGTIAAAFGYTGQKCSACSRAIVHADVYDQFVE
ncbi:MAG: proline dehydrogenase family protein, partial [Planctomycetota bacterium]|nr:proline dehydrogenase family protein [Planctomycetota bacterium]